MTRRWLCSGLVALSLVGACTSSDPASSRSPATSTTSTSTSTTDAGPPTPPLTDPALAERSIAVRGDVVVGETLTASISDDLAGQIESWGWHRCIEVPACQTVAGADTWSYAPTVDDAWQVLRVIAVARRDGAPPGAVTVVIGPVVNPDPVAFHVEAEVDPNATTGTRTRPPRRATASRSTEAAASSRSA